MLHQMAAGIVGHDGVRHAVILQLPGGQRGALVARPRLVDPDMDRQALVMGAIDRRRGRAPIDRGKPAGIAMGQDVDRLARPLALRRGLDQRQAMPADGGIDGDILLADLAGAAIGGRHAFARRQRQKRLAHAVQPPAQIDRRRPRRCKKPVRALEVLIARIGPHGERHSIGARRPDQRRAAHQHVANGALGILHARQHRGAERMRQLRLVDDADGPAIRLDPDRAIGNAADLHDSTPMLSRAPPWPL